MKLIFAVIEDKDSSRLISALGKKDFQLTKLSSTGGFLREGNTTLMIGCDDDYVDQALDIIRKNSSQREQMVTPISSISENAEFYIPHPISIEVGGAIVFVLPVEQYHQF